MILTWGNAYELANQIYTTKSENENTVNEDNRKILHYPNSSTHFQPKLHLLPWIYKHGNQTACQSMVPNPDKQISEELKYNKT